VETHRRPEAKLRLQIVWHPSVFDDRSSRLCAQSDRRTPRITRMRLPANSWGSKVNYLHGSLHLQRWHFAAFKAEDELEKEGLLAATADCVCEPAGPTQTSADQ
jgi:hypothetical protein